MGEVLAAVGLGEAWLKRPLTLSDLSKTMTNIMGGRDSDVVSFFHNPPQGARDREIDMTELMDTSDLTSKAAWQATLAELIAVMLFVFVGAGAIVGIGMVGADGGAGLIIAALAHGLAFAVLVAAIGGISGGHINPAVTVAAVVTGKMSLVKGVMYVVAQLVGALVGAALLLSVIPTASQGTLGAHALSIDAAPGLIVEMVLTFMLVFVIFATAMDPKGPGHLAPFAIGLTVMVDSFVGVPLTGASMNPARSFGPALATGEWADHWVYWVGPIMGAVLAAVIYEVIYIRGHVEEEA